MPNYTLYVVMTILGVITAIGGTVCAAIFLIPEKRNARYKGFLKILSDFVTFKTLYLDKVLKVLYVLCTLYCVCVGFFWLFTFSSVTSVTGLCMLLFGPIVVRLLFELLVMFVLLVNNVIEINNRLRKQDIEKEEKKNEEQ